MRDRLDLIFALCKSCWHDVCVVNSFHGKLAGAMRSAERWLRQHSRCRFFDVA